jgi:hypothetical protein
LRAFASTVTFSASTMPCNRAKGPARFPLEAIEVSFSRTEEFFTLGNAHASVAPNDPDLSPIHRTLGILPAVVLDPGPCRSRIHRGLEHLRDDAGRSVPAEGATWPQSVTIDRSDIFDTQGWAGVCDMVHVALVRGRCEPPGASVDVVAFLSETSFASISEIVGPLTCAGDPEPPLPSVPALGLVGSGALALTIAAFGWAARRRAGGRGAGPCASR